jgi:hypothetical protein
MQLSHSQSQSELFLFMLDQRHRLFLLSVRCELQSARRQCACDLDIAGCDWQMLSVAGRKSNRSIAAHTLIFNNCCLTSRELKKDARDFSAKPQKFLHTSAGLFAIKVPELLKYELRICSFSKVVENSFKFHIPWNSLKFSSRFSIYIKLCSVTQFYGFLMNALYVASVQTTARDASPVF